MDRSYKPTDLVHVYQSSKNGELLGTFRQQPFAHAGYDNYEYHRVMHKGYVDRDKAEMPTYILLDHPLLQAVRACAPL